MSVAMSTKKCILAFRVTAGVENGIEPIWDFDVATKDKTQIIEEIP